MRGAEQGLWAEKGALGRAGARGPRADQGGLGTDQSAQGPIKEVEGRPRCPRANQGGPGADQVRGVEQGPSGRRSPGFDRSEMIFYIDSLREIFVILQCGSWNMTNLNLVTIFL